MFSAIWALAVGVTLGAWLLSTLHVLYYKIEPSVPQPYPLQPAREEERIVKILFTWAYAPTFLAMAGWEAFKTSPQGGTLLGWLREKV